MPASLAARKLAAERSEKAWKLYCSGLRLIDIARELGLSEGRVSKMVRACAAKQPAASMTSKERSGLAMQILMDAHAEVKAELDKARAEGRTDAIRGLLSIQSLSASRVARVLEAQPSGEVVQQGPVFNFGAFAQLTGGAAQQQLPAAEPRPQVQAVDVAVLADSSGGGDDQQLELLVG